jgi:two-component system response regulator GlrR
VERAVALTQSNIIGVDDLPPSLTGDSPPSASVGGSYSHLKLQEARETFEIGYIREVLTQTGGNITHASKMAGIAWQNFHQKLKKYEIDAKSFSPKKGEAKS